METIFGWHMKIVFEDNSFFETVESKNDKDVLCFVMSAVEKNKTTNIFCEVKKSDVEKINKFLDEWLKSR